jgi:transposase-like protein
MICPHCNKEIIRSTKDEKAQKIAKSFLSNGVSVRDTAKALKNMGYEISYSTIHRIGKQKGTAGE